MSNNCSSLLQPYPVYASSKGSGEYVHACKLVSSSLLADVISTKISCTGQYSKISVKWPLQIYQNLVYKTNYCLMQVKSIAECSKGSILQYFQPSLSYYLSLGSLFCLFLSCGFTQVLLYIAEHFVSVTIRIVLLSLNQFDLN